MKKVLTFSIKLFSAFSYHISSLYRFTLLRNIVAFSDNIIVFLGVLALRSSRPSLYIHSNSCRKCPGYQILLLFLLNILPVLICPFGF